jgi:uncharacterized membrane protein/ribosomal protein L40E
MGRLGTGKTLGGVGSILELIPGVSIVGYILVLVGVKYIADELQDKSVFDNMLYAVIAGVVGVVVGASLIFTQVMSGAFLAGGAFVPAALAGLFGSLAIVWIALIISAYFIRKAYDTMATKLGVNHFRTAGTLYLVGAALTIILVGFIILLIAYIFQIIAFFSINEMAQTMGQPGMGAPVAPSGQAPMAGAPAPPTGKKFCPNCGASLDAAATFCPKCGTKQP